MVDQWNNDGGPVENYGGPKMVEQWNNDGGRVEQIWWTRGTVIVD